MDTLHNEGVHFDLPLYAHIEELKLPAWMYKWLSLPSLYRHYGYRTVGQLLRAGRSGLSKIPRIGNDSVDIIAEHLLKAGHRLQDYSIPSPEKDESEWNACQIYQKGFRRGHTIGFTQGHEHGVMRGVMHQAHHPRQVPPTADHVTERMLLPQVSRDTPIDTLHFENKLANALRRLGIRTIGDLIDAGEDRIHSSRHINDDEVETIRKALSQYNHVLTKYGNGSH